MCRCGVAAGRHNPLGLDEGPYGIRRHSVPSGAGPGQAGDHGDFSATIRRSGFGHRRRRAGRAELWRRVEALRVQLVAVAVTVVPPGSAGASAMPYSVNVTDVRERSWRRERRRHQIAHAIKPQQRESSVWSRRRARHGQSPAR